MLNVIIAQNDMEFAYYIRWKAQNNRKIARLNLYIYFACVSVCLYQINVKTAKPIRPIFLLDLEWPQRRFMDDRIFKKFASTKIRFVKI